MSAFSLEPLSRAVRIELDAYRRTHVLERVQRALVREAVDDVAALTHLLARDAGARSRFRRSVAVSLTGPFRDPEQFDLLERLVLPSLARDRRRISVWSAGCSNGSELYSVGLLLQSFGLLERSFLLGTDLLDENLALARRGVYDGVAMPAELRVRLRWEQRDLLGSEPRGGAFRLVLCRNVAIYLAPAAKDELHLRLAGALAHDGVLVLGRTERLLEPKTLGLVELAPHVYRREPR